jgi:hypothetical protein
MAFSLSSVHASSNFGGCFGRQESRALEMQGHEYDLSFNHFTSGPAI